MRNPALLPLICTFALILPACVTSSPARYQSSLTEAALLSPNSSCTEIRNHIMTMDNILAETGYSQPGSSNAYLQQAANTSLRATNVTTKAPYASSLVSMATSMQSQSSAQSRQMEAQTARNAEREKSRLIGLYQNKGC